MQISHLPKQSLNVTVHFWGRMLPVLLFPLYFEGRTQKNQYSPFFLLLFTSWTQRSLYGTVVVALYMRSEMQRFPLLCIFHPLNFTEYVQFHHRSATEATQRSKDASNKQQGEYWFHYGEKKRFQQKHIKQQEL